MGQGSRPGHGQRSEAGEWRLREVRLEFGRPADQPQRPDDLAPGPGPWLAPAGRCARHPRGCLRRGLRVVGLLAETRGVSMSRRRVAGLLVVAVAGSLGVAACSDAGAYEATPVPSRTASPAP